MPGTDDEPDSAGVPQRVRRRLGSTARRALMALGGAVLAGGSVAGFWWTADAFDERVQVVVAAGPIPRGQVLTAGDLAPADALLDGIPHLEWSPQAAAALAGFAVSDHVPAGGLIGPHLLVDAGSRPMGDMLEAVV